MYRPLSLSLWPSRRRRRRQQRHVTKDVFRRTRPVVVALWTLTMMNGPLSRMANGDLYSNANETNEIRQRRSWDAQA